MKVKRFFFGMFFVLLCLSFAMQVCADTSEKISQTVESIMKLSSKDLLADEEFMTAGNSVCDWIAFDLAMAGEKADYRNYLDRLEAYVSKQYREKGGLSDTRSTEYHRIALTVLALGADPTNFGEDMNSESINLIADGVYYFDDLKEQGVNALAYALLTLDAKEYELPEDAKLTREELVNQILDMQADDGGVTFSGGKKSDTSITAMCLQALAPYRKDEKVGMFIEEALDFLHQKMNEGFEDSETASQMIIALSALNIDALEDESFGGLLDELERFRLDNGMYKHEMSDSEGNLVATEQALLALEAYSKYESSSKALSADSENITTSIFDFRNYVMVAENSSSGVTVVIICTAVGLAAVLLTVLGVKKALRKN